MDCRQPVRINLFTSLGVHTNHILTSRNLKDNISVTWNPQVIADVVKPYIVDHDINIVSSIAVPHFFRCLQASTDFDLRSRGYLLPSKSYIHPTRTDTPSLFPFIPPNTEVIYAHIPSAFREISGASSAHPRKIRPLSPAHLAEHPRLRLWRRIRSRTR